MTDSNAAAKSNTIDLGQFNADEVHINVGLTVIVTTEDKVKLLIRDKQDIAKARDAWIAPLGVAVSMLLALISADFRDFVIAAPVWKAMFIIALLLSVCWLIRTLVTRPKSQSVEEFIQHLKTPEK